jgi:hypothetical protein
MMGVFDIQLLVLSSGKDWICKSSFLCVFGICVSYNVMMNSYELHVFWLVNQQTKMPFLGDSLKSWSNFKVSIAQNWYSMHNLLYNLLYQQPSNSLYNHTHVTKSLPPKGLRTSSPDSDSGVPPLTPGASRVSSCDHTAEFQEGPEGGLFSFAWEDTSLSSPSKSDHETEESACQHQATTGRTLQEKGTVNFVPLLLPCLDATRTSVCVCEKKFSS